MTQNNEKGSEGLVLFGILLIIINLMLLSVSIPKYIESKKQVERDKISAEKTEECLENWESTIDFENSEWHISFPHHCYWRHTG